MILRKAATVLLVVLLAVALVATIVVYRTISVQYEIPEVETVHFEDIPLDHAVTRLSQAIRFQTVSTQDNGDHYLPEFDAFMDFVRESYPVIHENLTLKIINGYTLLYKWEGSRPGLPAAMMQGHYDVVPVEPGTHGDWTHPPFKGVVADGFVWGRGAIDDKSGIFSYLEAVNYLLERGFEPERTVYLALNHDEEVGGRQGARKVADYLLENDIEIAFLVDEGMPVAEKIMEGLEHPIAMIGVAEKGYLSIEMEVTKEGGHSSMPPRETTIGALSEAITNLKKQPMHGRIPGLLRDTFEPLMPDLPFRYRMALSNLWLFGGVIEERLGYIPHTNAALRTTIAPTIFHAGIKENVLPQTASATINFRIHPNDNIREVLYYVQNTIDNELIDVRVLDGAREPSPVTTTSSEAYQLMKHTIYEVFPGIPVAPAMFLAATDARHFTKVTDHLLRFRPIRARPDDRGRIHGTDERISVENYGEMISFYVRFIENATSGLSATGSPGVQTAMP
jgi:carboxypeptidase PM20D1